MYKFTVNQIIMIQFVTRYSEEVIEISCDYSSLAKQYREVKFYILNQENDQEIFRIPNATPKTATMATRDLYKNSVLLIRSQFIVSKDLIHQKETILKATLVQYTVRDKGSSQTYLSDHALNPTEYEDKTTYTFVISKHLPIHFEN